MPSWSSHPPPAKPTRSAAQRWQPKPAPTGSWKVRYSAVLASASASLTVPHTPRRPTHRIRRSHLSLHRAEPSPWTRPSPQACSGGRAACRCPARAPSTESRASSACAVLRREASCAAATTRRKRRRELAWRASCRGRRHPADPADAGCVAHLCRQPPPQRLDSGPHRCSGQRRSRPVGCAVRRRQPFRTEP